MQKNNNFWGKLIILFDNAVRRGVKLSSSIKGVLSNHTIINHKSGG